MMTGMIQWREKTGSTREKEKCCGNIPEQRQEGKQVASREICLGNPLFRGGHAACGH